MSAPLSVCLSATNSLFRNIWGFLKSLENSGFIEAREEHRILYTKKKLYNNKITLYVS
jgi:hypothetical protein